MLPKAGDPAASTSPSLQPLASRLSQCERSSVLGRELTLARGKLLMWLHKDAPFGPSAEPRTLAVCLMHWFCMFRCGSTHRQPSRAWLGWLGCAGWAVLRSLPSAAHLSRTPPLPLPLYPCGKLGQSLWGKQIFQFKIWISVLSPGRELGVAFPPSPVSTCSVLSSCRIFVLLDNGAAAHLL